MTLRTPRRGLKSQFPDRYLPCAPASRRALPIWGNQHVARILNADTTFDEHEEEATFTMAAIEADPDAVDLLPMTATWLPQIAAARANALSTRQQVAKADALRIIANGRLDAVCVAFGDSLYAAVQKDRASARWKTFFSETVSSFVKQGLDRQVKLVKGWLGLTDAALDPHRAALTKWSDAAADAQVKTAAAGSARGQIWQQREALGETLTRERDGLHAALGQRARDRNLPRDWPDLFFRVQRSSSRPEQAPPPAQPA